jgi:ATP-dependent DNA ligase
VIPDGQYGAGPVIVWDAGTYRNRTEQDGKPVPVERAVEEGHVTVWLEGRKLRGGYALTRIGKGSRGRWLLVKMDDEEADARRKPVKSQPESVRSGRTIQQVGAEAEAGEDRRG